MLHHPSALKVVECCIIHPTPRDISHKLYNYLFACPRLKEFFCWECRAKLQKWLKWSFPFPNKSRLLTHCTRRTPPTSRKYSIITFPPPSFLETAKKDLRPVRILALERYFRREMYNVKAAPAFNSLNPVHLIFGKNGLVRGRWEESLWTFPIPTLIKPPRINEEI